MKTFGKPITALKLDVDILSPDTSKTEILHSKFIKTPAKTCTGGLPDDIFGEPITTPK